MRPARRGVDAEGWITTGVSLGNVGPPYDEVVRDVVGDLQRALDDALHSVRLYGSVATGQAVPPTSDLDVYVVLHRPAAAGADVGRRMSARHAGVVREIGVVTVTLGVFEGDGLTAVAERCWVRHHTVHVWGPDLAQGFARCRPSVRLAAGFDGNVQEVVAARRADAAAASDDTAAEQHAVKACRKLLMAAATILSAEVGGWSTDRRTGAALLEGEYPEHAEEVERVRTWADRGGGRRQTAEEWDVLGSLAAALARRIEHER